MSIVKNGFPLASDVNVNTKHPKSGDSRDTPPQEELNFPRKVGGSEGYLHLQAKKGNTPQPSAIHSIETVGDESDKYEPICKYDTSTCIWIIGATLKKEGSLIKNIIKAFKDIKAQTDVNVEIGPKK